MASGAAVAATGAQRFGNDFGRLFNESSGQQGSSQSSAGVPDETAAVIRSIQKDGVIVQSGVKGPSVPKPFDNDGRSGDDGPRDCRRIRAANGAVP